MLAVNNSNCESLTINSREKEKMKHIMTEAIGEPTKSQRQKGYSTWKLPSEAHIAIRNMCNIELKYKP